MAKTQKPRWVSVLLFFVYLGILEGVVRVGCRDSLEVAEAPPPPASENASNLSGNPYLLWELEPGLRTMDGVPTRINSLGMRGPEPTLPKPAGVRRILLTGDSSNFGFRVADGHVLIDVATEILGGARVDLEGWNASVPGYSTYQTINFLEMRAWSLDPDVLVVGTLSSDNNFDAFVDRDLIASYSRFESGWLARVHQVLKTSALYRLLDYRTRVAKGAEEAKKVGWGLGTGEQIGSRRVEVNDYASNLDYLVESARDRGVEVVFLLPPVSQDMDDAQTEPGAWVLYREVMRDASARYGVPIVEGPDLFKSSGRAMGELFLDEMHPTTFGHRILGEALAEVLQAWVDGGSLRIEASGEGRSVYVDRFLFHELPSETPADEADPNDAVESSDNVVIRGTIFYEGFAGQKLQLDVRDLDAPTMPVLDVTHLDGPGAFELNISPEVRRVSFVLYEDEEGDGPSAGDERYDFSNKPLRIRTDPLEGLELHPLEGEWR